MGRIAKFPEGPFYLSAKYNKPVIFVSAVKETGSHYHFFASKSYYKKNDIQSKEYINKLLNLYIEELANGKYPKKLNWVLQNKVAYSEWILFLDADEFLTESFKKELKEILPHTEKNGFWLTYDNYFDGSQLKYGIPFKKLLIRHAMLKKFRQVFFKKLSWRQQGN